MKNMINLIIHYFYPLLWLKIMRIVCVSSTSPSPTFLLAPLNGVTQHIELEMTKTLE